MRLDLLSELCVDEKKSMVDATIRFEAALRKSAKLKDGDSSPAAKVVRDMVNVEETRLTRARVQLAAARDSLTAYPLPKLGSRPRAFAAQAVPKAGEDDVAEKQEKKDEKLSKRKLPAPKDGWLDKKVLYCIPSVIGIACSIT